MINRVFIISAVLALSALCVTSVPLAPPEPASDPSWQEEFDLATRTLVSTGRNGYFVLEPGFQIVLESNTARLAVTVLDETREVDGVLTRIVEEREWINDQIVEVSRNYFAIDEKTKDVFYFGEEVDMYQGGKLTSHSGAWLAGKKRARAGMIMPGKPTIGMRYYQEVAPGIAMDRAEVVRLDETLDTPAGMFTDCLKTQEGTALNLLEQEFKTYAPGIGLIQDENLLLTEYGTVPLQP
jgi:hypothetical protein